jgi:hypothetical protein
MDLDVLFVGTAGSAPSARRGLTFRRDERTVDHRRFLARIVGALLVRIRSRPELGGENDNSIYRYDREALLSALATDIAEGGGHG